MKLWILLFKQGFKSIFKYKTQLVIVMLLVFFSTFYLTITFLTSSRINQLYDDVVTENGKKFDYTSTTQNGTSKSLVSNSDDIYVMMNDFVSNQYVSIIDKNNNISTSPNFLVSDLASLGGENNQIGNKSDLSFIQKAFASDKWKKQFKLLYVYDDTNDQKTWENGIWNYSDNGSGYNNDIINNINRIGELGISSSSFIIDQDLGGTRYIPASANEINSSNGSVKIGPNVTDNSASFFQRTICDIIGILIDYFDKEIDYSKNLGNLSSLPLAIQYFSKNNDVQQHLKNIVKDFGIENDDWNDCGWSRLWIQANNWLSTVCGKKYNNDKIFAYLYNAFSTIAYSLLSEILSFEKNNYTIFTNTTEYKDYISKYINKSGNSKSYSIIYGDDSEDQKFDGYNKWVTGKLSWETQPAIKNLSLYSSQSDDNKNYQYDEIKLSMQKHMYADWAEIFGTDLNNDSSSNNSDYNNLLIHKNNAYDGYKLNLSYNDDSIDTLPTSSLDVNNYGYRGFINPINFNLSSDKKNINTLKFDLDFSILGRYEWQSSFTASRAGIYYNYDEIDMHSHYGSERNYVKSKRSIAAMEKLRSEMAGYLTNVDVSLREEYAYYDTNARKNFRFVVFDQNEINKKNQYYKIIEGVAPIANNEILINEQFAIKNNIKIGSTLKIGKADEIVSGFAVDTLSYYPIGSLDATIPDVQKNAIVYMPKLSLQELAINAGISDDLISSNYWFYSSENNDNQINQNIKLYSSFTNNDTQKINESTDVIYNNNFDSIDISIKKFSDSNWIKNWTIQPLFMTLLSIISFVAAIVILVLAFFAIAYAIRKNIQNNVSQIAYMKCIGIKGWELAISYVGYAFFAAIIIVPLGWLIGCFVQELIARLLMQYLTTQLYEFIFNWKLLLILIVTIGFLIFFASFIMAVYYNSKTISTIITGSKTKKLKYKENKLINKLPFRWVLNLKIAQRSSGSVITFAFITGILSFVVTIFTFIPSMFNKYISDSKTFFAYNNSYLKNSPYENSPLSKTAIGAWNGPDYLEENNDNSIFKDSILEEDIKNYFPSESDFSSSNNDTSIFPTFQITHDCDSYDDFLNNISWTSNYILNDSSSNSDDSQSSFIVLLIQSLLEKLPNMSGFSLSTGDIERYQMMPAYLKYNINNNNEEFKNTVEREKLMSNISSLVQKGLPTLLKTLIVNLDDLPATDDWRNTIINLIQSFVPSLTNEYFSNSTRLSEFSLMLGADNFVPNQETLATTVNVSDSLGKKYDIDGLKKNQKVYNLNKIDTSKIFLDNKTINELNVLINSTLNKNGNASQIINDLVNKKIYNKETKTLIVPTISNKTVKENFDFKNFVNINTNYLSVPLEDQNNYYSNDIPKGAWVYDNRDYEAFKNGWNISDGDKHINDQNAFLDPFSLQSGKFAYEYQFENKNNKAFLKTGTSCIQQIKQNIDADGNISYSYEIRPNYNYGNVRIYFPKKSISNILKLATRGDPNMKVDSDDDSNVLTNQGNWYGEASSKNVPQSVKDAWNAKTKSGKEIDGDYIWVDPYNLQYSTTYSGSVIDGVSSRHGEVSISDVTNTGALYTFGSANIGQGNNFSIKKVTGNLINPNIQNIKFDSTAVLNTFNDSVLIADQDLLNLILGYTTDKYVAIDDSSLNESPTGSQVLDNGKTINTYEYKDISKITDSNFNVSSLAYGLNTIFNGNEMEALLYDTQPLWYNNKYSQFTEPIGITTGLKADLSAQTGFSSAAVLDNQLKSLQSSYSNITFASSRIGIIISISDLLISICFAAIFGILLVAVLYLILMSDAFISSFSRFILIMKALGYKKKEIVLIVVSVQGILNIIAFSIGMGLGAFLVKDILWAIGSKFSVSIPYVVSWYLPVLIIILIVVIFISVTMIGIWNVINEKLTKIFKD